MQTIKKDISTHHEGSDTMSLEITLTDELEEQIKKAQKILEENPFISSIDLDAWGHSLKEKQFDSTIDDEDAKEITCTDFGYFSSDVAIIKVFKSGSLYYRMYNKWDGSQFIELPIVE